MDDTLLRSALRDLTNELRELDRQLTDLRKLQDRRDQLYQLVTQMRFVLGMGPLSSEPEPETQSSEPESIKDIFARGLGVLGAESMPPRPRAIWEHAREILSQAGRPMDLGELIEALRGLKVQVDGRAGKETVRAILYKKTEVFERMEDGKYKLK